MLKKLCCLALVFVSALSCGLSASAEQNISNTYVTITAANNSGGTPYGAPQFRRKYNATSVWCQNLSTSGGSALCWVSRYYDPSTNADISRDNISPSATIDRYYGSLTDNGPTKNAKTLPKGTYYYLPNYVNEDGYTHATLDFIMNTANVYYALGWSPDSI